MVRFWLLQHDHSGASDDYEQLVAGFYAECLARFPRDYNLVLCRKSRFRHFCFTLYRKVKGQFSVWNQG